MPTREELHSSAMLWADFLVNSILDRMLGGQDTPGDGEWIESKAAVAEYVDYSIRAIDGWIEAGTFPPPDKTERIGKRVRHKWLRKTVDAWIDLPNKNDLHCST